MSVADKTSRLQSQISKIGKELSTIEDELKAIDIIGIIYPNPAIFKDLDALRKKIEERRLSTLKLLFSIEGELDEILRSIKITFL